MDNAVDPDDRSVESRETAAVPPRDWFRRVIDLRVLGTAIACVFGLLGLVAPVPAWALVAGGLSIFTCIIVGGRPARTDIRRSRPAFAPIVWPNPSMKAVVEALPDPCIMTDSRGIVRYVNELATQRFGLVTRGDPLNFKLRATALNDALERVVAFDRPETAAWQEKIPTERWLEVHLAPIHLQVDPRAAVRRPDFVILVIEDLTEQRRSERMRADFVANASHELRTPLASLTGFIETLQGPARNDVNAREKFLLIMAQQAARMKRLIDDLLSLSRIEMKAHVRPETWVDLSEIIRHVVDSLAPLATENNVEITVELAEPMMQIRGDRDELVQVFSNLVENGIKYGASGGQVTVSAEREATGAGSTWVTTVRDFGPGIAEEHLPRLTERFYRADIVSSREKQGTGLGLAIVKHILTRHHGRLQIESSIGNGAAFSVRLEAEAIPSSRMAADDDKPMVKSRQTSGQRTGPR